MGARVSLSGAAIAIGMLLAVLGPLLLLPATWLVYRIVVWPLWRLTVESAGLPDAGRFTALTISVLLVLGAVGASYAWGRMEFDRLCANDGTPEIERTVRVDGYFRTPLPVYEARQILGGGAFSFVEGPGETLATFKRYTLDDEGALQEAEVPALSSEFGVRETFETMGRGITMTQRVIFELGSETELARAASLTYMGGPLSIFLGSYGMRSCPDPRSFEGSEHFRVFYNLSAIVLGGGPPEPPAMPERSEDESVTT